MYLMCGPRQLFFQCGTEMPKGWTLLGEKEGQLVQGQTAGNVDGETELDVTKTPSSPSPTEDPEDVTKVTMHPDENTCG